MLRLGAPSLDANIGGPFIRVGIPYTLHQGYQHSKRLHSLLHHVVIDEWRHEGDGEGVWALSEDFSNVLVLQANDILAIDLSQVVVYQDTIPMGGTSTG